jgi:acetyltransferase-like isoleucine patch superfamily enzyme
LIRRPAARRFAASILDARAWLHIARLVHYWNYSHVSPRRRAHIARNAAIAPDVSFRNGERISIGERAHIGSGCSIWAGDGHGRVDIGEDALFGPEVFVTASNYRADLGAPIMLQPREERDVAIGRDVWLGARVIVLPGVRIGDGTVVGAGSVVTRSLPEQSIAVGAPARVVRQR